MQFLLVLASVLVEIVGAAVEIVDFRCELVVSLPKEVGGRFGLAASGEHSFLIATDARVSCGVEKLFQLPLSCLTLTSINQTIKNSLWAVLKSAKFQTNSPMKNPLLRSASKASKCFENCCD